MTFKAGKTIVLFCFALLVVFISITKISDYDFWWHLKLGETIYNSGKIYTDDEFSYTFNGQPQFNAEWLADLIMYISYNAGGLIGVNILKVSILLLTFLFLFMTLRNLHEDENAGFYATIITLVLVLFSIRFRLFVRPYLFSYLFFSIFLFVISHYERKKNFKILCFSPLIEIIWANMSIGAVFGPILFFFFVISDFIKNKFSSRLSLLLVAVFAASLFNPEMYRLYSIPFSALLGTSYRETVGEHQPITIQLLWGYGFKYTFAYQILATGSMIYLIFLRGWKNVYHFMLFAVFFVVSVLQVRMIDFFSLVAAVIFITPMTKLLTIVFPHKRSKKTLTELIGSALILLIGIFSIFSKTYAFGIGVKEETFPDSAIAFLEQENIKGMMFNSYSFGGYILWSAPERKVFIDGRHRHLYSPEFYNTYHEIFKNAAAWKAAEQQWGFDYALIEYDLKDIRFPKHINENPDWALVYWDNHSAIYLKRTEKNHKTISAYEYKVTKPNFNDFSYLMPYLHSKNALNAIEQIDREIALNPSNQEPRLAKVFLLYNMGSTYNDAAMKELEICQKLKPDIASEHSAMAFILLKKGFINKAKEEVKNALKLHSHDPGANYLKNNF